MKQEVKFLHRISKGSRFNQIYIPQEMNKLFEVGDEVEIRLIKKKQELFKSKNLPEIGDFKEGIIKKTFSILSESEAQIFFVGSFLTKKTEYRDIDLLIIGNKLDESKIQKKLEEEIPLKFHILIMTEEKLKELAKFCPITRSMLFYFISNKEFKLPTEREINIDHINFLMMMPEDLLKVSLNSYKYYEAIRRLVCIEMFLKNEDLDSNLIERKIEKIIGKESLIELRSNSLIKNNQIETLKKIIQEKIKEIRNKI